MSCGTCGDRNQSKSSQTAQAPGASGAESSATPVVTAETLTPANVHYPASALRRWRVAPSAQRGIGARGVCVSLTGLSIYDTFEESEAMLAQATNGMDDEWQATIVSLWRDGSGEWKSRLTGEPHRVTPEYTDDEAGARFLYQDTETALRPSAGFSPRERVYPVDSYEVRRRIEPDQTFNEIIRASVAQLGQSDLADWQAGDLEPTHAFVERFSDDSLWATVNIEFVHEG